MTHYEALKLNNFEVFVSMLKFMIATGIFNKPFLYMKYGISNCMLSDCANMALVCFCNASLIKCMEMMPMHLTCPSSKLTYGTVVGHVLD